MEFLKGGVSICKPSDFNVSNAKLIAKHYLCPDNNAKKELRISNKKGKMHNSFFAITRCDPKVDPGCEPSDYLY